MVDRAAECEVHRRAVDQIIKVTLDEAGTGLLDHHQLSSRSRGEVQGEGHRRPGRDKCVHTQRDFCSGGIVHCIEVKIRGNIEIRLHIGIGARVCRRAIAPVDKMKPRVRHRCDGRAIRAVVDRLRRGASERSVCSRRVGQRVGVNSEICSHVQLCRHVSLRAGVCRRSVAPVDKVVVSIRYRCDGRAIGSMVNRLRRAASERAICIRGVGQSIGIDGKIRRHAQVAGDARVRARIVRRSVAPVDKVVASHRHSGHFDAICSVINRLRCAAGERAVCIRGVVQRVGVDSEIC